MCQHTFASVSGDCFDALTHVVIRVSSAFIFQTFAEVCYSVFVKRSSFKSVQNLRKAYISKNLLKVYYRSVFNESSKAFIFQKDAESLHTKKKFYFGLSLHIFLWKMRATPGACIKSGCLARCPLCHKVHLLSCLARRP